MYLLPTLTVNFVLIKEDSNVLCNSNGNMVLISYKKPSCDTLRNAWDILLTNAFLISLVMLCFLLALQFYTKPAFVRWNYIIFV